MRFTQTLKHTHSEGSRQAGRQAGRQGHTVSTVWVHRSCIQYMAYRHIGGDARISTPPPAVSLDTFTSLWDNASANIPETGLIFRNILLSKCE
jgi:hypothetical protein